MHNIKTMRIYNISNQLVTILKDKRQPAGNYSIRWNGKDRFGNDPPSRIYFSKIKTEQFKNL